MNVLKDRRIAIALFAAVVIILYQIMRKINGKTLADQLAPGGFEESNLSAFLWMIRECEGTANDQGYRTLYGYQYFDDFSRHPNKKITSGGIGSTAAGAYQILFKTWAWLQTFNDLPDFSPESQDKAAVALIKYRGALEDVYAGRIETAIEKCSLEWASLPGSPYGQPVKTLSQARSFYTEAGGNIA